MPVEVEVETLEELREAIAAGADIAMLDEFFTLGTCAKAVRVNGSAARPLKLEASGGITLRHDPRDRTHRGRLHVSVGSITKHVRAVDLSMRFEWQD